MTEPSTPSQASPDMAADPGFPIHPSAMLLELVIALLAPLFLGVSAGNVEVARLAALETVNAYRARNQIDLLAVAQVFAFGLATLSSLTLSMAGDLSLSMILRLRGSANALSRSAEKHRCARQRPDHQSPCQQPAVEDHGQPLDQPVASAAVPPAHATTGAAGASVPDALPPASTAHHPVPATTPMTARPGHQPALAAGVTRSSHDCPIGLPHLQPAPRREASLRAAALSSTANGLLSGTAGASPTASPGHAAACGHPARA